MNGLVFLYIWYYVFAMPSLLLTSILKCLRNCYLACVVKSLCVIVDFFYQLNNTGHKMYCRNHQTCCIYIFQVVTVNGCNSQFQKRVILITVQVHILFPLYTKYIVDWINEHSVNFVFFSLLKRHTNIDMIYFIYRWYFIKLNLPGSSMRQLYLPPLIHCHFVLEFEPAST